MPETAAQVPSSGSTWWDDLVGADAPEVLDGQTEVLPQGDVQHPFHAIVERLNLPAVETAFRPAADRRKRLPKKGPSIRVHREPYWSCRQTPHDGAHGMVGFPPHAWKLALHVVAASFGLIDVTMSLPNG